MKDKMCFHRSDCYYRHEETNKRKKPYFDALFARAEQVTAKMSKHLSKLLLPFHGGFRRTLWNIQFNPCVGGEKKNTT